jgi:hypothetical protein
MNDSILMKTLVLYFEKIALVTIQMFIYSLSPCVTLYITISTSRFGEFLRFSLVLSDLYGINPSEL